LLLTEPVLQAQIFIFGIAADPPPFNDILIVAALLASSPLGPTTLTVNFPGPISATTDGIQIIAASGLFANLNLGNVDLQGGVIQIALPGTTYNAQSGSFRIAGFQSQLCGPITLHLSSLVQNYFPDAIFPDDFDSTTGNWPVYTSCALTPTGSPTLHLIALPGVISLNFSNVSAAGNTSVTSSSSGPSLPAKFTLDNNTYYNLTTTAKFSGSITVCIAGNGELLHNENGTWVDVTLPGYPTASMTCGSVTSLSPFAVVHSSYSATIQPPINAGGTSVFASRGVVPVKFKLSLNGAATCQLPPATISLSRTSRTTVVPVNESEYHPPSDRGSNFSIDSTNCQYIYNLTTKSLGVGTYRAQIKINGIAVGQAVFGVGRRRNEDNADQDQNEDSADQD